MTNEEIISESNKLIVDHLLGEQRDLKREDSFADDLGADSLDMLELTMAFEEHFNVEIGDEEVEGIETVGDAHDLILKKLIA